MKTELTQYTITTDAVTMQIEAPSKDIAAQHFASSERIYGDYDIKTAKDLANVAKQLGGWAEIYEA